MLCILEILVALVVLAVIVVGVYIKAQGDAEMLVEVGKRTTAVKVAEDGERLDFEIEVPYRNAGKQEGTIIDAYMRIYLPQEQYADVLLRGKVNLKGVKRDDDYFEAVLVPEGTGKTLLLRFEAYAKNGKTIAALPGPPRELNPMIATVRRVISKFANRKKENSSDFIEKIKEAQLGPLSFLIFSLR